MDYEEFRKRIKSYILIPNDEQTKKVVYAAHTIHFQIGINRRNLEHSGDKLQAMCDAIYTIEERGGIYGEDFFVCVFQNSQDKRPVEILIVLHSLSDFLHEEDLPTNIKRYNE